MTTAVPLVVWPWPISDERLELLKRAKATLTDIDVLVVPEEGVAGTQSRVLSFGGRPDFACKYAPIRPENVENVESISAALRYVLTTPVRESEPFSVAEWLSDVAGVPIRYSHSEDETGKIFYE